jgi:acylphosphatase
VKIKEEIIIEGPCVHDVGYRIHLLNYAIGHDLVRFFAFNQEEAGTQRVVIRVEDTDESISAFLEFLEISRPARAKVSRITHTPYKGKVQPFKEFRENLNSEQLAKGINAILDIRESNKEINASIKEINASNKEINASIKDIKTSNQNSEATQKEMCAGQEEMIAKQNETITEVRGLHHDISKTFDDRLNRIEEKLKVLEETIQRQGVMAR